MPANSGITVVFDSLIFGRAYISRGNRSGIFRYSRELLSELSKIDGINIKTLSSEFLLEGLSIKELASIGLSDTSVAHGSFIDRLSDSKAISSLAFKSLMKIGKHLPWVHQRQLNNWQQLLSICPNHRSVFHSPYWSIPQAVRQRQTLPAVLTVHDMLPILKPELFTRRIRSHFRQTLRSLKSHDHIICISEATRRDFISHNKLISEKQIHVIPLAASKHLKPITDQDQLDALRRRLGLSRRDRIILSLSTLEPRKNLSTLLHAFERIHHGWQEKESIKLVLAGNKGWKINPLLKQINSSPIRSSIVVADYIPECELSSLYSLADVFVYPSLYEGFGLPVLEAMQCGAPVITSNTSSLPEVVGDGGVMVNPHDCNALKDAIQMVLTSSSFQQELRHRARHQAKKFSWKWTAEKTAMIYEQMLSEVQDNCQ